MDLMKIIDLIKISRPILWIVFPFVFYLGLAVSGTGISFLSILIMIMLSFPICLAGYGINDIYDYKTDKINPRKKTFQGHIVHPKNEKFIKNISIFIILAFLLSVLLTKNLLSMGIAVIFVLLGYYYSAPPFRLKEKPPLDSLSNGLIYWSLPFSLGFSLSGNFSGFPIIKNLWLTLGVTAVHAITTIMDFSVDKKSGIMTFATRFGKRNTAIFAFVTFLLMFLFGQFLTFAIRAYILFCAILAFSLVIFPNERFAKIVVGLAYIGLLIVGLAFLI